MAHAKIFGASNSERWLTCLAAPSLEAGMPNKSSPDAQWGTAAHFLGAYVLEHGGAVADYANKVIIVWEHPHSKSKGESFSDDFFGRELTGIQITEFPVDSELVECVTAYVEFVRHLVETTGGELFIETRVSYRDWLPPLDDDDGFGTADCIIVTGDELIVVDLKGGAGVKVDAVNNTQLRLYALGAYAEHSLLNDFKQVRMVIHQPRKGGVSEWVIPVEDLLSFGEYVRERATLICNGGDLPAVPSKKACQFCKAKSTCPTLQADVLATVLGDFDDLSTAEPRLVPVYELADVWEKRDMIRGFLSAIEERMFEQVQAGAVPGYKIVEGRRGNRAWSSAETAEASMKAMRLKTDEMYNYSIISPAAAEKLLKARPRLWNKIKELIVQPAGKDAVAPVSDPRPAKAKVVDDFNDESSSDLF
jgi:hypothetical protein